MAVDADFIHELFSDFGAVQVRRMFGGAGLFVDGLMFGLVIDGAIYLKTDADGAAAFERENCGPFGYSTKHGRRVLTSYWRLPDRLYDNTEELAQWARRSLAVARAKSAAKPAAKTRAKTRAKKSVKKSIKTSTKKSVKTGTVAPKRRKSVRKKSR